MLFIVDKSVNPLSRPKSVHSSQSAKYWLWSL